LSAKDGKHSPRAGGDDFARNPFASLSGEGLPPAPESPERPAPPAPKNRGRVDILRQTAHRGGKTVTVITNFSGICPAEKDALAKRMQKTCGTGGTVKDGRIELQGDQRDAVVRMLTEAGFRPVLCGG
jgi:translation initiation factor 1